MVTTHLPARSKLLAGRASALALALALVAPMLATGGLDDGAALASSSRFDAWALDRDGNGLDDKLDKDLAAGTPGTVYLHVHYGRRPVADDAALLERDFGALRTYVFRNWDSIKAEAAVHDVPGFLEAPGVVAVEKFVPPVAHLDVSTKNTRVNAAAGVPVAQGIDHALAVHETLGFRGEGMVIAILDTGVDNTHESLDDQDDDPSTDDPKLLQRTDPVTGLPVVAGADASDGFVVVGCVDPQDDNLHGTHVAGIALGTGGPSKTFPGMAPQARLVDVDIAVPLGATAIGLGEDIGWDWVISFNKGETCYGDPGADIIDVASMSFGAGGDEATVTQSVSITTAVRNGITATISAGNSGPGQVTMSVGSDGAIIVASSNDHDTITRADDTLSGFSSRGPRPDDGDADALDELRPDIAAPGDGIVSAALHTFDQYIGASGTSMAAPTVAGIAALVLQANPSLRPVDLGFEHMGLPGAVPVRDVLQKTAQYKVVTEGPSVQQASTGKFGLPWNNGWGYGLIDAYAAVQMALGEDLFASAGGPYAAAAGVAVTLQASAQGGTPPYTFAWDLGDGASASGASVNHAYAKGLFEPVVTVTDATGKVDVAQTHVRVTGTGGPGPGREIARWDFDSPDCLDQQGWFHHPGTVVSTAPQVSAGGSPWHLTTEHPASSPCAWYHGLEATNQYTDANAWNLDSPGGAACLWVPPGTKHLTLGFDLAGASETGFDFLITKVRHGACADNVAGTAGQAALYVDVPGGTFDGAIGDPFADPPAYETQYLDLRDNVLSPGGGFFQVRFRFEADNFVTDVGWRIDNVHVIADNDPPVLTVPGDQAAHPGVAMGFVVGVADPEGDPTTVTAEGVPAGASFDPATGAFAWTPAVAQLGTHTVTFRATDGLGTAEAAVAIHVANAPPAFDPLPEPAVHFGDLAAFTVAATDPDGDPVTLAATQLPAGASFDPATGAFAWIPGPGQVGDHAASFRAEDGLGGTAEATATIHVVNEPPVLAPVGDRELFDVIETLDLQLQASDADGDALAYTVQGLPAGATFDATAGRLVWTPTGAQDGTHQVTFRVGDGAASDEETITILVKNVLPVAAGQPDRLETDRLTAVRFADQSTDVDGEVVAWRWSFGDGAESAARNPAHTYASLGTFTVTLTVTDDDGDQATAEVGKVKVKNLKPKAKAEGFGGEQNRVDPTRFRDASSDPDGEVVAWAWAFGDGATSAAQDPAHQYAALGTFHGTLTVTDSDGDTDAASFEVAVVNLRPSADFVVDPDPPTAFLPTFFDSQAADRDGSVATWAWTFGNGLGSDLEDPATVYAEGGPVEVVLTVTDDEGASTTVIRTVFVCNPGLQTDALLDPSHIRLEVDQCLHLTLGEVLGLV